ncbi:MAG: threonine/serine dehydratase, partial [Gemmatimonadota bacterium]|nr:threonine/serine dehydratase [Gemmatimonadota bacterium]
RTPLLDVPALAEAAGVPVWLKPELLQAVGAFKLRGAFTAVRRLPESVRSRGLVTQSSGNHGQAVAWAGQRFGVRAVVVMPESTPKVKVDGAKRWGGEVVFAGAVRGPEQLAEAERLAADEGLTMIPPFDHPDVIAGQGTIGLELAEQLPELSMVLVPVSGGGLIAGIAAALGEARPDVEVVGVEPAGAAKLSAALAAGRPVPLPEPGRSMADGLLSRQIGAVTWPVLSRYVRRAVTVTDEEIGAAVRTLYHSAGLVVEPSGAVTSAALLARRIRPAGPVVAIASGGNIDPALLERLVA